MTNETDNVIEVFVPTFANPHLFWIIQTKDICIRNTIERRLCSSPRKRLRIRNFDTDQIFMARVDNVFVRVRIVYSATKKCQILNEGKSRTPQFVCWLLDYGILRVISELCELPDPLLKCAPLAKQACLNQVVNLRMICIEDNLRYVESYTRTLDIETGVSNFARGLIENSSKIRFAIHQADEDRNIIFGDILCMEKDRRECSLTETLIAKSLMAIDMSFFMQAVERIVSTKETYFSNPCHWVRQLDNAGFIRKDVIYNDEVNDVPNEFLERVQSVQKLLSKR